MGSVAHAARFFGTNILAGVPGGGFFVREILSEYHKAIARRVQPDSFADLK
jgi:hypothetical protein